VRDVPRIRRINREDETAEIVNEKGVVLFFYADKDSYIEVYIPSYQKYEPEADAETSSENWGNLKLHLLDMAPWQFYSSWTPMEAGQGASDVKYEEDEDGNTRVIANVAYGRRWFLAFMRLMWQEILVPEDYSAKRAERRRWEAIDKKLPLDGGVKVLKLRRIADLSGGADHDDEDSEFHWKLDHRIQVRPFWRNQFYPSLGPARLPDGSVNPNSHRLIYIDTHYRGPEFAALVEKYSITEVTR